MEIIVGILILLIWALCECLFFHTHRRPLNDEEVTALYNKRRRRIIGSLYRFRAYGIQPDKEFKSSMNHEGRFYPAEINMYQFPSYAAALLKYKKYEWIVVGLADGSVVRNIWVNRGFDNASVSLSTTTITLINTAHKVGCNVIMSFHNHPNPNPQKYNMLVASKQDVISSKSMSEIFNNNGLVLLEYVCERGNFKEYYRSFPLDFSYGKASLEAIRNENGRSVFKNYRLHRELGFFHGWQKSETEEYEDELRNIPVEPLSDNSVQQKRTAALNNGIEKYLDELQSIPVTPIGTEEPKEDTGLSGMLKRIDTLSGVEFEKMCAMILSGLGFQKITETPTSGDHGVDLIAWKFKKKFAFQCKRYEGNVGNKAVQEVFTGKKLYAASEAVVMTNSHFTRQAREEAADLGVILWDREIVIEKAYQAAEIGKEEHLP